MVTPLPGAVGVSGLQVYDWPTVDGVCGGSPHVHLTCTEGYVVVAGTGQVQTLTYQGFAETPLTAGTVVWFTPGTIHRLINGDGRLRIVVIMQNSGLPEAGDAVFTFPTATLADTRAYGQAAALADGAHVYAAGDEPARRRRDLAIEGFLELRTRVEAGDLDALGDFYRAAARLTADKLDIWTDRWRTGALAAAHSTYEHLEHLRAGAWEHLKAAQVHRLPPPDEAKFGMCGRLDTYDPAAGRSAYG